MGKAYEGLVKGGRDEQWKMGFCAWAGKQFIKVGGFWDLAKQPPKGYKTLCTTSPWVYKSLPLAEMALGNQYLLITISELKTKLAAQAKNVNTKFDKSTALEKLFCIAPLNKNKDLKATTVSKVIQIVIWIVDSGCLGHNLFSVRQFCDGDLEVAFRSNTCFVWNLEGEDLLTGSREYNLYTISISDMTASSPVCLMSKATSTKSWLWHRQFSHLNFGTINKLSKNELVDRLLRFKYDKDHLCSACEQGKSKKATFPSNLVPSTNSKLELLHIDLCGPMRVETVNGKHYILNGVVERRNRTLVEAAKKMLIFSKLPKFLWAESISIAYFTPNLSLLYTHDSSEELNDIPSQQDLDNLFGPLYEEYYAPRTSKVLDNFTANTLDNEGFDGNTIMHSFEATEFEKAESSSNF
ncbi:retrovirus-related pol polyprotein from transposon TNT 1-94 [Tanacetum coccineum]|uniref:Retrovirus-related pol polyprotein from transposon TNT 1-94 n=1 Tax=Tanacetum coccineum TaxID=301880 RepID=A0ABQ5HV33_9ASTR